MNRTCVKLYRLSAGLLGILLNLPNKNDNIDMCIKRHIKELWANEEKNDPPCYKSRHSISAEWMRNETDRDG